METILAETPQFAGFEPEVRAWLATCVVEFVLGRGTWIFRAGERADDLYVLVAGEVELLGDVVGSEICLASLSAPTIFGEMGVLGREVRSLSVRAASDVRLLAIPAEAVRSLPERSPASALSFFERCFLEGAARLRTANEVVMAYYRLRLEQVERERKEQDLFHLLVHDMRSPHAVLKASIDLVLDARRRFGPLTQKQERALRRAQRSAVFLGQLVEEVVEVGRSEAGALRTSETTLRAILATVLPQCLARVDGPLAEDLAPDADLAAVSAAAVRGGIHLELEPGLAETRLVTDALRFAQVLLNLIGNALKYAPGWIAVRGRRAGDRLRLEVIDRGPGIPERYRALVFERYRQLEARAEGVPRGFGLGLAGAAALMDSLGGDIRADEGDGGVGTRMVVELPFVQA